jgi:hypothetical protein
MPMMMNMKKWKMLFRTSKSKFFFFVIVIMTLKLNFLNNLMKKQNVLTFLVAALVLYCLMTKTNPVDAVKEGFSQLTDSSVEVAGPGRSLDSSDPVPASKSVKPNDKDNMEYGSVNSKQQIDLPSCTQFVSSNLLPKDDPKLDENFSEFSPAKDLEGQSFIDTNKYAIGMQSQTLRNANHQLRSDPPISNTMKCSSPWNNTTISAEARRPLSIGSTA